jgi:hypothetical protein
VEEFARDPKRFLRGVPAGSSPATGLRDEGPGNRVVRPCYDTLSHTTMFRAKVLKRARCEEAGMGTKHMLKYHVAIPLGIMAVLLLVGVPLATAFVVGMMAGCMSMMLMMMGTASRPHEHHDERDNVERKS